MSNTINDKLALTVVENRLQIECKSWLSTAIIWTIDYPEIAFVLLFINRLDSLLECSVYL